MSALFAKPNDPWTYLGHEIYSVSRNPDRGSEDFLSSSDNNPVILLVHGFGASTDHWRFNIPVISQNYEVHAIDLIGFGRSAKPSDLDYGGELWKEQIVAYVKERIKKPTVIIGNSLGGYAALAAGAIAAAGDASVAAAVAVATLAAADAPNDNFLSGRLSGKPLWIACATCWIVCLVVCLPICVLPVVCLAGSHLLPLAVVTGSPSWLDYLTG